MEFAAGRFSHQNIQLTRRAPLFTHGAISFSLKAGSLSVEPCQIRSAGQQALARAAFAEKKKRRL
ncbi:MAG: hypothetical protein Q4B25_08695, partial [Pseudomonadota bacterium]|nr:hypothetical protein [Pseudomonadota bacterium]